MPVSPFKHSVMRGLPLWKELAVLGGVGALLFWLLVSYEAFETLFEFSRTHEDWELDELVLLIPVSTLMLAAFSYNRVRDAHDRLELQKRLESENIRLATKDMLTGLPNRDATLKRVDTVMVSAGHHAVGCLALLRSSVRLTVARAGSSDDVRSTMKAYCDRVAEALPHGGFLGSFDPDTCIIYIPFAEQDAQGFLERALAAAAAPVSCGVYTFLPMPRMGAKELSGTDRDFELSLSLAQEALEKSAGLTFHRAADDARELARRELVQRVVNVLGQDRFECVFQPIVDLKTGSTVAFETLSRWPAGDGDPVAPDAFVDIIEQAGLIGGFTDAVLAKSLAMLRRWPAGIAVSVNVARKQLHDPLFAARVKRALKEHGAAASRLHIEITETSELLGVDACQNTIASLQAMGVKISVDDFGAGYANLNLLHDIDFDNIKIDRKIISDILTNPKDKAIVAAMVTMTHAMKRTLTAEGVEDGQTAAILTELGVDRAQGWHFSRPMNAQDSIAHSRLRGMKQLSGAR